PRMAAQGVHYDPSQVLVMILAGGEGKRLYPLTLDRAKPAVPFAGRYRIIDSVLSNFVNSGLSRIELLTQYKSASLEERSARRAAATIAPIPVPRREASSCGVLEIADDGRIVGFHDKVQSPPTMPGSDDMCLASMGNYVFRTNDLIRELARDAGVETSKHDFG